MATDANPSGYKGSSQHLCELCFVAKKNICMDVYIKPVDRRLYYRCPKCGHTLWDVSSLKAKE